VIASTHTENCRLALSRSQTPPLVQQETGYTCGPASLRSWFLTQGIDLSEKELSFLLNTTEDGTKLSAIRNLLTKFGFANFSRQDTSLGSIKQALAHGIGVLVLIQSEGEAHWSLVVSVDEKNVTLMDPWVADQYRRISRSRFYKIWFGDLKEGEQKTTVRRVVLWMGPR